MLRVKELPFVYLCHLHYSLSLAVIQDHDDWLALILLIDVYLQLGKELLCVFTLNH